MRGRTGCDGGTGRSAAAPGSDALPPFLTLAAIEKSYGATRAVAGVSLEIEEAELLALVGPSGSGKTTLLRLLAGFEPPDRGRIAVAGEDVTRLPAERRRFGMVFQHYALFPHLDVAGNVAFGLPRGRAHAGQRRERVAEVLALVGLGGFEGRRVAELSGGEQQRVALARAIAPSPRVLLLDEPLSNLDPGLRERTRRALQRLVRELGITTLIVTHEQQEAFELGDRVAVLSAGRLHQVGTPRELYDRPASRFVAGFVGRAGFLPAVVVAGAARMAAGVDWRLASPPVDGAAIEVLVRPELLELAPADTADALTGTVAERRFAGAVTTIVVSLAVGAEVEIDLPAGVSIAVGDAVAVRRRAGSAPLLGFAQDHVR